MDEEDGGHGERDDVRRPCYRVFCGVDERLEGNTQLSFVIHDSEAWNVRMNEQINKRDKLFYHRQLYSQFSHASM